MHWLVMWGAVMGVAFVTPASAQQAFDACQVFTQADAEAALGAPAQGPVENPKVKRPKIVPACRYTATRDGRSIAATAQFRTGKSDAEVERAFEENRLQFQT